jgi:type II restriction enzyme
MTLQMNQLLADGYKSASQIARVLTEDWVLNNGYCPACQSRLIQPKANAKVLDFLCSTCDNDFELKSKKGGHAKKVVDGAYSSMIERIELNNGPHFFFLAYDDGYKIKNLIAVPNYFFQPIVIEKRKPLPPTAKRPNWVGCNILLDQIPNIGKIKLIDNSIEVDRNTVQHIWQKTLFLKDKKEVESRGWLLDVLKCIEMLKIEQFNLEQIYSFEDYLSVRHPNNRHIKDKIRQQLQVLRDKGIVEFEARGNYRLIRD